MRFKVDQNLHEDVAELLRANGHDAMTTFEQGLFDKLDVVGDGQGDRVADIFCARLLAAQSPRAIQRAILVIGREDFIAWLQLNIADGHVDGSRGVGKVNNIVGFSANIGGQGCARVFKQFGRPASQELNRL